MTDRELGGFISTVEHPRARGKFRADLRRALVATATSEWSTPRTPAASGRFAWLATSPLAAPRYALAFAVMVLAIFSASGVAAASSLPGDPTYSLKVAYEQVELALATDDAAKVEVLARQADRRLDELNRVAASRPDQAPTASDSYRETVARFEAAVLALRSAKAGDREDRAVDVAVTAAEKHIAVLEAIRARHETPGLDNALQQAQDLERKAKDKKKADDAKDEDGNAPREQRATPTPRSAPRTSPTPRPDGEHD